MNIFQLNENTYKVEFSPQALLLKPFREIWDNDKSKDKENATKELGYVYFMCDQRSDHMYILDQDERHEVVSSAMELGPNWIKPTYIDDAMDFYLEMSTTTSTMLLNSTRNAIQKISHFLDVIDPNERDKNTGKPVFGINTITGAIEKVPKLVKALAEIEKEIIKEKAAKAQSGNKDIGMFDDNGM